MNTKKQLNDDMLEKVSGGKLSESDYKFLYKRIQASIAEEDIEKAMEILNNYTGKSVVQCSFLLSKLKRRDDCPGEGGASGSF